MSKMKNKNVLIIAAVLLVVMTAAGTAGAFFSDYEHAIGKATFSVGGETTIDEEFQDNNKIISIQNKGEGSVFVRMKIFGPEEMIIEPGEGWSLNEADGFYYYSDVLDEGGATSTVMAKVDKIPMSVDLSEMDIIVVHESVPVVYDKQGNPDSAASWKAAEKKQ